MSKPLKLILILVILILIISTFVFFAKKNGMCVIVGDPPYDDCVLKFCSSLNIDWRYCR